MKNHIAIVGAGLAGCEAALTLAKFGHKVVLYEQKPIKKTDVYQFSTFSELVCNNALCPQDIQTPLGLLTYELIVLQSSLIQLALECRINDEHYFAIDKQKFSRRVTDAIRSHEAITVINEEIQEMPEADYTILASGPLTNKSLLKSVSAHYGMKEYHFSDASSSVVDINSINLADSHITKLSEDLFIVRIPEDIFIRFSTLLADFYKSRSNKEKLLFQECESIERLASKGAAILCEKRFTHAGLGSHCLLLRRENGLDDGFIMVGSMTMLRHSEQKKAFSLLPGFSNVRFVKFGRMHRNTFFDSPGILNSFYQVAGTNTYIIGQLSGIDGYVPAISSGHIAALHIQYQGTLPIPPKDTMIGGLANYVSNIRTTDFQPMCANYSLLFGGSNQEKNTTAQESIKQYMDAISRL